MSDELKDSTNVPSIPASTEGSPIDSSIATFQVSVFYIFLPEKLLRHLEIGRRSILAAWDSSDVSYTLRDSTKALAFAFYGKYHHCTDTAEQGSVIYSRALLRLKQDLDDGDRARSRSVMVSTIALILYEVSFAQPKYLGISRTCWHH